MFKAGFDYSWQEASFALKDAEGRLLTNGGRVLCVTSFADNLEAALAKSYAAVKEISWEGCHYRRDIGRDLM